jgi:beta-glucosidase
VLLCSRFSFLRYPGAPNATAYPAGLTATATWNSTLAYAYGAAQGREQFLKGSAMLLGPGMDLARVPVGGRNFEYAGEDPVLASVISAAIIQGIQSQKVSACAKHFLNNEQEDNRGTMSANVGLRAEMELYLKPFFASIDAGVGSIMASYNRINGTYSSENPITIGWIKENGGFDGNIVSDWGAVHSTVPAANAGCDQEMPDSIYFGDALLAAVEAGNVSQSRFDDMAIRVLTPLFEFGFMDDLPTPQTRNLSVNTVTPESLSVARAVATEAAVLLQNVNNSLPIVPGSVKSIAILGLAQGLYYGGGSGSVVPQFHIPYYEALFPLYNNGMKPTNYSKRQCNITADTVVVPADNATGVCLDAFPGPQSCADLCASIAGCNSFNYELNRCITGWGWPSLNYGSCTIFGSAASTTSFLGASSGVCEPAPLIPTPKAPQGGTNISVYIGGDAAMAQSLASEADVAIVFVGTTSAEGNDRPTLALDPWMDELVFAVSAVNNRTVVVVNGPGAVLMPWASAVQSIVYSGMPGIEAANALGDILTGKVAPSGKLPLSFPVSDDATWLGTNPAQYPGTDRGQGFPEADYTEGLSIGYRYYDLPTSPKPLWPFGHGVSYTTFRYEQLTLKGAINNDGTGEILAFITVANTGDIDAQEVVQLYVSHPAAAQEPPKVMVGFQKVLIPAGKAVELQLPITPAAIAIYDVTKPFAEAWTVVAGQYQVLVGASSADIRLTGSFTIAGTINAVQVVKGRGMQA